MIVRSNNGSAGNTPTEGYSCGRCRGMFARLAGRHTEICPKCEAFANGEGYLSTDPERTPTPHYMRGGIECIDAMRAVATPAEFQAFCRLTAFKYLWRLGEKDSGEREAKKCLDYVRWMHDSMKENRKDV